MTPRKNPEPSKRACHVCSRRSSVGVWRDQHGNKLAACETEACITGYTLERRYKEAERG